MQKRWLASRDGVSLTGGRLDLTAISHSQNDALTIGANGGVLTVPVAIPATINTVNTRAEIGDGAVVTMDANLNVLAEATATFNTRLQASAGGVLTGGGGDLDNTVTADVVATIGAAAQLTANLIDVRAETIVDKPDLETAGNVHATTGGAVAGLGVDSRTLLDLQTQVTVAANANLQALHSASQAADINLHAHNTINATDRITMFSGGLASGGGTFSRIETLINEATVTIEAGAVVAAMVKSISPLVVVATLRFSPTPISGVSRRWVWAIRLSTFDHAMKSLFVGQFAGIAMSIYRQAPTPNSTTTFTTSSLVWIPSPAASSPSIRYPPKHS